MFPKEIEWRAHLMERVFLSLFFLVAAEFNACQSLTVFLFCIHFVLEVGTLRSAISTAFENGLKQREKGENER